MFMMISFRVLLLLLRSREFFIFQIADVHLLHSATWWRLLGQKHLLTAEVTRLRLRGERLAVWCGNRASVPRLLQSGLQASDGLGFLFRRGQCRQEDRCQASAMTKEFRDKRPPPHEPNRSGRDAFHRVPNSFWKYGDAVERVP